VCEADTVIITATFTEANGINEPPTITIANGGVTAAAMTKLNNLVWTYTWNVPTGNATATVSISATDMAGSPNSPATGKTVYTIDNTAPTVVLSDNHADAIVCEADTVIITATFTEANGINEPPTITIANGGVTAAAMTKTSNLIWTYTWNVPTGNAAATVSISATDVADNPNSPATGKTVYTIDNTAPTVVLTDNHDDAIVCEADTVIITATFTEANGINEANPHMGCPDGQRRRDSEHFRH
ncbi:MAG: hypothetical protein NT018_08385, partial [Armatimonadetes bacterium]|nr:hypothetical protein [Armatimonadota bacterium]